MKVLVVGGGAREHALAWKIGRSPSADEALADLARDRGVGLTVIGPEASLAAGLADELSGRGLAVFGASRAAAEIESSKAFAKEFMRRHGIPTAPHAIATSAAEALAI